MLRHERKSFYYHYKDKYDLVNSIFQSEFADDAICRNMEEAWICS